MIEVNYYRDEKGNKPVKIFIDNLEIKLRAKIFSRFELLEEFGNNLGLPYSRFLGDGIFELRVSESGLAIRILFFFTEGHQAILTHGFIKKSKKTLRREIDKAKRYKREWEGRHE